MLRIFILKMLNKLTKRMGSIYSISYDGKNYTFTERICPDCRDIKVFKSKSLLEAYNRVKYLILIEDKGFVVCDSCKEKSIINALEKVNEFPISQRADGKHELAIKLCECCMTIPVKTEIFDTYRKALDRGVELTFVGDKLLLSKDWCDSCMDDYRIAQASSYAIA